MIDIENIADPVKRNALKSFVERRNGYIAERDKLIGLIEEDNRIIEGMIQLLGIGPEVESNIEASEVKLSTQKGVKFTGNLSQAIRDLLLEGEFTSSEVHDRIPGADWEHLRSTLSSQFKFGNIARRPINSGKGQQKFKYARKEYYNANGIADFMMKTPQPKKRKGKE